MLIEPTTWQADRLANGFYTVTLKARLSLIQAQKANDYVAIYIKDRERDCDMCCPTCGGTL